MSEAITMQTPASFENEAIREHARLIVQREVYYCVSSLVSALQSEDACSAMGIDWEDVRAVCVQDDYMTPVTEYIQSCDSETVADVAEYFSVEIGEFPDLGTALVAYLCESGEWRDAADYCRIDPDSVEAYEHWLVSSWLANELEELGEMVSRDICGLTVWGRACTGQAIYMDSVMLEIARDALAA